MIQVHEEFISAAHEAEIVRLFERAVGNRSRIGRAVFRFGRNYVSPFQQLHASPPVMFAEACERLATHDAVTVNVYEPGVGISPHVDSLLFEDEIHVLSLWSACEMTFVDPQGAEAEIALPRRSLLTMNGDERRLWQHGTEGAAGPRISVVYRKFHG